MELVKNKIKEIFHNGVIMGYLESTWYRQNGVNDAICMNITKQCKYNGKASASPGWSI